MSLDIWSCRNFNYFSFFVFLIFFSCGGADQATTDQTTADGVESEVVASELPKYVRIDHNSGRFVTTTKKNAEMILIPEGPFFMGTSRYTAQQIATGYSLNFWDEQPQHKVELEAFYIDRYEVTNEQYARFLKSQGPAANPPKFWNNIKFNNPRQPIVGVTWDEAVAYAQWTRKRLPTEAEWEKAASWAGEDRATIEPKHVRLYPWGNAFFEDRLNYNAKYDRPTVIGFYPTGESDYELLDMAGNVSEWVQDYYNSQYYYTQSNARKYAANISNPSLFNEKGIEDPNGSFDHRVHRGGKWNDWRLKELAVRAAARHHASTDMQDPGIGFRCAVNAKIVYNDIKRQKAQQATTATAKNGN